MKRLFVCGAALMAFGWGAPASAECLARTYKDFDAKDKQVTITAPAGEISAYQVKGYAPVACGEETVALTQEWVCKYAQYKNKAVQNRLEQVLGARADKVCISASLVKGVKAPVSVPEQAEASQKAAVAEPAGQ